MSGRVSTPQPLAPLFIHGDVDDYGLSPAQFRVLCAIARRGECFETVASMARRCQLHPASVRAALKYLASRGIISIQRRMGATNLLAVCPANLWRHTVLEKEAPPSIGRPPSKKKAGEGCGNDTGKVTPPKYIPLSYSPAQGNDPLFISTWEKWMEYRRGLRNKPKNIEGMFAEQLAWLAGYPNAVAIEIIQQSLRNGWQGLFPPKGGGVGLAAARPSRRTAEETYADHAKGF